MDVLSQFDSWLEKIRKEEDRLADADRITSICEEATKRIRKEIVQSWYPYRYASTLDATEYKTHTSKEGNGQNRKIMVVTDSYVDSGQFFPPSSTAQAWVNRHPEIPIFLPPNDYVLYMLMDLGIVGLPERETMTGTGWVNDNFKKASNGLEEEYFTSGIWQKFESYVKSKL